VDGFDRGRDEKRLHNENDQDHQNKIADGELLLSFFHDLNRWYTKTLILSRARNKANLGDSNQHPSARCALAKLKWRRGRDSNSRSKKWTPGFKTGGFSRAPTPAIYMNQLVEFLDGFSSSCGYRVIVSLT